MSGEDGWRWACIIWKSGNAHQSRKLHYFVDGDSLCGAHYDGGKPWIAGIYKAGAPPRWTPPKCKKCQRKLEPYLQKRFCKGCPTQQPDYEKVSSLIISDIKRCPCPNGVKDWQRCNWHMMFKQTGLWIE